MTLSDWINSVIAAAAAVGVFLSLSALRRDRADRDKDRQDRLEQRATRQATAVRVRATLDGNNLGRPKPMFYPTLTNGSDCQIFDVVVAQVVRVGGKWVLAGPMPEIFAWRVEVVDGNKQNSYTVTQAVESEPQLLLTFTDRYGDRWERNPDGVLSLVSPAVVRRG